MEDPGSFSGSWSSPNPDRGPDAKKRISLLIFNKDTDKVFRAADKFTNGSWDAIDSNLFGAGKYLVFVNFERYSQKTLSKFLGAFIPVPTAVPPWAKNITLFLCLIF